MDIDTRTVLVIVGVLVMIGILVDGFRRMRRARQEALKIDVRNDFQFPEENFSAELPNGGARVVGELGEEEVEELGRGFMNQLDDLPNMSALDELEEKAQHELSEPVQESLHEERIYAGEPEFQTDSYQEAASPEPVVDSAVEVPAEVSSPVPSQVAVEATEAVVDIEASNIENDQPAIEEESVDQTADVESDLAIETPDLSPQESVEEIELAEAPETVLPKAKPLNLDEHVPLLMDVEQLGEARVVIPAAAEESELEQLMQQNEEHQHIELTPADIEGIKNTTDAIADVIAPQPVSHNAADDMSIQDQSSEEQKLSPEAMAAQAAYAPVKKPSANAERLESRPAPNLVLVTHVIPNDEDGFCGEDILYLVNSCDLRHGEKEIFHRFEKEQGEGKVQFSMANSFNPGIFDPETLLHERIHGVSLFMSLPGPDKAMDAFEAMTEMAQVIARNLGGEVQDETHSVMALQTIEHNRQQVRDFVRKQKLAKR